MKASIVAHFLLNDYRGILKKKDPNIIPPDKMMLILDSMIDGQITRQMAKAIIKVLVECG
jgi:Asp-tRNA(Asn)/Glu-tRNA(Gln) amidotransferase B subunit